MQKKSQDPHDNKAFDYSLKLLGISPRSRKALREKLEAKGYSSAVVEETLSRLEKAGYLNDREFAAGLIGRYSTGSASGRRRIDFEMKRRGLPPGVRREALEALTPEKEQESALELGRSRWRRFARLEPKARAKKVHDFLLRRGFDYETARSVLAQLKTQDAGDFDDEP